MRVQLSPGRHFRPGRQRTVTRASTELAEMGPPQVECEAPSAASQRGLVLVKVQPRAPLLESKAVKDGDRLEAGSDCKVCGAGPLHCSLRHPKGTRHSSPVAFARAAPSTRSALRPPWRMKRPRCRRGFDGAKRRWSGRRPTRSGGRASRVKTDGSRKGLGSVNSVLRQFRRIA